MTVKALSRDGRDRWRPAASSKKGAGLPRAERQRSRRASPATSWRSRASPHRDRRRHLVRPGGKPRRSRPTRSIPRPWRNDLRGSTIRRLAGTEGDKGHQAARSATGCGARRRATSPLQVREGQTKDSFEVAGRGELQLSILIETHAPRGLRAGDQPGGRVGGGGGDRALSSSRTRPPASGWSRSKEVVVDVERGLCRHGDRPS